MKQRTHSIDFFRCFCALLVVLIHSSFYDSWGSFGVFLGEVLPRIAVPFFFAVSGYFYIKKLEERKSAYLHQIIHYIYIYIYSGVSSILPKILFLA